jgi:hypothetical protein
MKPIKILPHHAKVIFGEYYLGLSLERPVDWYYDEPMRENGLKTYNTIMNDPDTLIQIVDGYDEICRMCPRNKLGENYSHDSNNTCINFDGNVSDRDYAKILGLESVLDGKPIASQMFFKLMRPVYEKLIEAKDDNDRIRMFDQMFRSVEISPRPKKRNQLSYLFLKFGERIQNIFNRNYK